MTITRGVIVRPKVSLLRNGLIAVIVGGVPLFGVLAWLGVLHGTLPIVIGGLVFVVFATCFLAWRHGEGRVRIEDGVVHKITFASDLKIPTASIARIVIAETDAPASESVPQLLALDELDRRLFRMRGLYWSIESMHEVADAVGAPIELDTEQMTPRQFYAKYRGSAYWYEGKRWLAVIGLGFAAAAAFGLVLLMMTIAGAL